MEDFETHLGNEFLVGSPASLTMEHHSQIFKGKDLFDFISIYYPNELFGFLINQNSFDF